METQLRKLEEEALGAVAAIAELGALEDLRVKYLGRKGRVTELLRGVSQLPVEQRPVLGQAANKVKNAISQAMEVRKQELESNGAMPVSPQEAVDLSLPGRRPPKGHLHPISLVADEMLQIFAGLGFQVATGPDIESEYYNFESLNIPEDHPARDSHDTFFVKPGVVLRTHTSPVQMRVMEKIQPPVAIVAPGRVYRVDMDATHSPMFYQIEGLLVDENVTFADLKGTIMHFIHRFFGQETQVRFRPHFFPFTEPSAEVDIFWKPEGASTGKWLEIMGCGMVHPTVFRYANYDSEKYTGFAFGMGVDRIAMVKYGISSINYLYDNDFRFLEQF